MQLLLLLRFAGLNSNLTSELRILLIEYSWQIAYAAFSDCPIFL